MSTWIFQNESYRRWIDEDCRLLWIKGKPGSGKSTIMKLILDSFTGEHFPDQLQLYFFFHRRGSQLQYTQLGMFRSLVHQLNCQVASVRTMFDMAWAEKKRTQGTEAYARDWRLEELRDLFSKLLIAAAEKQKIRIFVDALDEAGEDAAKDLLYYFHALSNDISESQAHVCICFSCRRYPVFASHGGLEIWVDQENLDDITRYTVAELNMQLVKDTGHQKAVEILKRELIRKASGVFLWIALMIPIVTKDYNDGEFLQSILRRLEQVPSDLSQIYEYILTKVVDLEKRSRSLRFMQWIFFAERRLAGVSIVHALACDENPIRWSQISVKDLDSTADTAQIEKSVLSLSGGLAEIEHNDDDSYRWRSYVQFIHESVNDFWRKDRFHCLGFDPKNDSIGEIHYALCAFCLDYSKLAFKMVPWDEDRDVREKVANAFPFILYATTSWLAHAKKAELRGVSVAGLLPRLEDPPEGAQAFHRRLFGYIADYLSDLDNVHDRFTKGATMLHMAAAFSLESLMRALLENGAEVNQVDYHGSSALAWAAGYHHTEEASNKASVQVLLDYGADVNAPLSRYRHSPLSAAAILGDEAVVRLLVEHGADVNAFVLGIDHTNVSPLEAAAESQKTNAVAITRFLLDSGADVNPRRQFAADYGDSNCTLLDVVFHYGTEELLQLLLERGARVNLPHRRWTILQYLVCQHEQGFVRLVLAHGAHVNVEATERVDSPLGEAAKSGSHAMMRMLLEAGADVFRQTQWYGTLYQIAKSSEHDSEAKVRLLLEFGYGRRWALRSGLSLARTAQQGSEAMLRLLLLAKVDKARDGYTALLRLAKGSDVEREGKVKLLLQYKYGARWLNSDWASAASSFRRSEGVSEESDG